MAKKEQDKIEQSGVRPPIVTVMGHVDHGKTSLLDAIRQTNVAGGESGGITQHIGAYQVEYKGKPITFIDTPGHAAFTQMRSRGAKVTDIVVLVVAADDGVMPQTKEAIAHAQAAKVPMIVALNKIDMPGANADRVKEQLSRENVIVESYGGDVPVVETSAVQKRGIDELLEMILLVADLHDLHAETAMPAEAVVIESHQDARRGPLATVIVQRGILKVGDVVLNGQTVSKIRALTDDKNAPVRQAGPSMPVEVLGLKQVPSVGSLLSVRMSEKEALAEARELADQQAETEAAGSVSVSVEDLFAEEEEKRELKLIVKADTAGSLEAIVESIKQLENDERDAVKFILTGTGNVSESDVLLASTAKALLLAFRVKIDEAARNAINQEKVLVQSYEVIYQLLEDIEDVLEGGIPTKEVFIKGRAEVLQTFELNSGDVVAGCRVTDGMLRKGWSVKVTRGEELVLDGATIDEVRHGREKVNESKKNSECGILLKPNFAFRAGDVIEVL